MRDSHQDQTQNDAFSYRTSHENPNQFRRLVQNRRKLHFITTHTLIVRSPYSGGKLRKMVSVEYASRYTRFSRRHLLKGKEIRLFSVEVKLIWLYAGKTKAEESYRLFHSYPELICYVTYIASLFRTMAGDVMKDSGTGRGTTNTPSDDSDYSHDERITL